MRVEELGGGGNVNEKAGLILEVRNLVFQYKVLTYIFLQIDIPEEVNHSPLTTEFFEQPSGILNPCSDEWQWVPLVPPLTQLLLPTPHWSYICNHCRTHTQAKPYKCTECVKSFSLSSTLIQHQITHIGERPYECPKCGKSFNLSSTLLHHQCIRKPEKSSKPGESQQLPQGSERCRVEDGPSVPKRPNHSLSPRGNPHPNSPHKETHPLGKSHLDSSMYPNEVELLAKYYNGSKCLEKPYKFSEGLEHSMRSPGKPYSCGSFRTAARLILRQQSHLAIWPYECMTCGRRFMRAPMWCSTIEATWNEGQATTTKRESTRVRRHTAAPQCYKAFSQGSALVHHQCIRRGEKPYHCSVYGTAFQFLLQFTQCKKVHLYEVVHCYGALIDLLGVLSPCEEALFKGPGKLS
uniref:Zinc finger protein 135-like n=1 Tax=Phascolarctos cinereus TaxID=38626 RepID=A0A6P5LVR9_PHACI|nr:zinc finger protein 135-like [Phascolarctos cinereus]